MKYQRQAIEKVDYMQVMQRQLALFEKALAEKTGSEPTLSTSGSHTRISRLAQVDSPLAV